SGQSCTRAGTGGVEQACGGVKRSDRRERGYLRARERKKFQRGRSDDAERAFRSDEDLLQVVAGVVLAQAAQAVPYLAGGKYHLEAKRQIARVAIAQHLCAAGVGREVAADGCRAFRGETERIEAAFVARRLLHRLQDAACLDGDRVVVAI